jgi:neuron navigator 2
MVAAFEQSLANMTSRQQQLSLTIENKDREIQCLRQSLEKQQNELQHQSSAISEHQQSHKEQRQQHEERDNQGSIKSSHSLSSSSSLSSSDKSPSKEKKVIVGHKKFRMRSLSREGESNHHPKNQTNLSQVVTRHNSNSNISPQTTSSSWIRSSISRAFRKGSRSRHKSGNDSNDENDTDSPFVRSSRNNISCSITNLSTTPTNGSCYESNEKKNSLEQNGCHIQELQSQQNTNHPSIQCPNPVQNLKSQLQEKDRALTDIRLEALSAAHQMESMKETVDRMKQEMESLRKENRRLQFVVHRSSVMGSSMGSLISCPDAASSQSCLAVVPPTLHRRHRINNNHILRIKQNEDEDVFQETSSYDKNQLSLDSEVDPLVSIHNISGQYTFSKETYDSLFYPLQLHALRKLQNAAEDIV